MSFKISLIHLKARINGNLAKTLQKIKEVSAELKIKQEMSPQNAELGRVYKESLEYIPPLEDFVNKCVTVTTKIKLLQTTMDL